MYFKMFVGIVFIICLNFPQAESITSLVEFFSYRCSHCANVNATLEEYVTRNNIDFTAVNVDTSSQAMPTNIMYLVAQDAGSGFAFQRAYFGAIAQGMPAYTKTTLDYVSAQVMTPKLRQLLKDSHERERVKQQINQAMELLKRYPIQATPTFLVNGTTLLEGEDVLNSLNWSSKNEH